MITVISHQTVKNSRSASKADGVAFIEFNKNKKNHQATYEQRTYSGTEGEGKTFLPSFFMSSLNQW